MKIKKIKLRDKTQLKAIGSVYAEIDKCFHSKGEICYVARLDAFPFVFCIGGSKDKAFDELKKWIAYEWNRTSLILNDANCTTDLLLGLKLRSLFEEIKL